MDSKQKIYALLENKEFDTLLNLFDENPNLVRKYLTMAAYYTENSLGHNALVFFRFLSENRSSLKPKYFRETIRRHIWGMNEEGGNNDWSAPEIIASIIAGNPGLFGEFTTIMISAAIDEPFFQKTMLKAIRMIGLENKELLEFEYHLPKLLALVDDKDQELAELARTVIREIQEVV